MALFFNATCLGFLIAVFLFVLDRRYTPQQALDEPPVVRSFVPYVGHIVGLIRYGIRYYHILRYGSGNYSILRYV